MMINLKMLAFAVALAAPTAFSQTTWYVNQGSSIQAVISDPMTVDGDTIQLSLGTFHESIDFQGKTLHRSRP
jgi:hypothetical protein